MRDVAAFSVEPIEGHGVNVSRTTICARGGRAWRREHGTLFVADVDQDRDRLHGWFWVIEHWGVEPFMPLDGEGALWRLVPVGVVLL